MKLRDVRAVYNRAGDPERALMRDLLRSEEPRQAIVLAEILAYFPEGVYLDARFRGGA